MHEFGTLATVAAIVRIGAAAHLSPEILILVKAAVVEGLGERMGRIHEVREVAVV